MDKKDFLKINSDQPGRIAEYDVLFWKTLEDKTKTVNPDLNISSATITEKSDDESLSYEESKSELLLTNTQDLEVPKEKIDKLCDFKKTLKLPSAKQTIDAKYRSLAYNLLYAYNLSIPNFTIGFITQIYQVPTFTCFSNNFHDNRIYHLIFKSGLLYGGAAIGTLLSY